MPPVGCSFIPESTRGAPQRLAPGLGRLGSGAVSAKQAPCPPVHAGLFFGGSRVLKELSLDSNGDAGGGLNPRRFLSQCSIASAPLIASSIGGAVPLFDCLALKLD